MDRRATKQGYSIGPGAASLLLIVVTLCLTVLGILALISARSDHGLSVRNQEMVTSYYQANALTQRALADLDAALDTSRLGAADDDAYLTAVRAALPDGFALDGRVAVCEVDAGSDRVLTMTVEINPMDDARRYRVASVTLSDDAEWEEIMIEDLFSEEDLM